MCAGCTAQCGVAGDRSAGCVMQLTCDVCVCAGRTAQCGVTGDRSAWSGTVAVGRRAAAGLTQTGWHCWSCRSQAGQTQSKAPSELLFPVHSQQHVASHNYCLRVTMVFDLEHSIGIKVSWRKIAAPGYGWREQWRTSFTLHWELKCVLGPLQTAVRPFTDSSQALYRQQLGPLQTAALHVPRTWGWLLCFTETENSGSQ